MPKNNNINSILTDTSCRSSHFSKKNPLKIGNLISEKSSKRELLLFLRSAPKSHVIAVCVHVNREFGTNIPCYGSKHNLIESLTEAEHSELWDGIDNVFEEECADEEFDESEEEEDEDEFDDTDDDEEEDDDDYEDDDLDEDEELDEDDE